MSTVKPKRVWRRPRSTLGDAPAPQVVTEHPSSQPTYPSNTSDASLLQFLRQRLSHYEQLCNVENSSLSDPRVKHIRDDILQAMPNLYKLVNGASSSTKDKDARQVMHLAEDFLSKFKDIDLTSLRPSQPQPQDLSHKSRPHSTTFAHPQVIPPTFTRSRAIPSPSNHRPPTAPTQLRSAKPTYLPENHISHHQITLLSAVHTVLQKPAFTQHPIANFTDAPAALSPDELHHINDPSSSAHHHIPSITPSVSHHSSGLPVSTINHAQQSLPPSTQQHIPPLAPHSSVQYPLMAPSNPGVHSTHALRSASCDPVE